MIECIIFDCDGTLVDSEHLCNLALEQLLKEYAVYENAEMLLFRYRGLKLAHILKDIEDRFRINFDSGFVPRYRDLVAQLFQDRLTPVTGVRYALDNILLPKCIASGGPIEKIQQALQITNLAHYFHGNIFSSYNVQSWKPEPDLFLFAAHSMGFAPSKCAVVEDSPVGIEAARRAGMIPFLYDPLRQSADDMDTDLVTFDDMKLLGALIHRIDTR